MKLAFLLAFGLLAGAPEPAHQLHSDVIKLLDLIGAKAAIQNDLRQLVNEDKARMTQACPACDPAFGDEWARRMLVKANLSDFTDVYVRAYENYFSDDEVKQLIAAQKQIRSSKPPNISDKLRQKLAAKMRAIQSEISSGTTQLAAKLGGDIGREIQKEHPEYLKRVD